MGRVYLLGSSHVSHAGAVRAADTIKELRPDVVAVELCPGRLRALREHGGRPRPLPVREGLRLLGVRKYLLVWMLTRLQAHYARIAGAPVGTDMLHALDAARDEGIPVALVDDQIERTVDRLASAVGPSDLGRLVWYALRGDPWLERFDIASVPDDELVEKMLHELEVAFPRVYDVLVRRRNLRMAARLLDLARQHDVILAVVGAGHKRGVARLMDNGEHEVTILSA